MKIEALKFVEKLGIDHILNLRKEVEPVKSLGDMEPMEENQNFDYYIILPKSTECRSGAKASSAIFLFHGLNERSWSKYIPWAEFLAERLCRPVILFPLSMHINRSPFLWSDARAMQKLVDEELKSGIKNENLTFVNYALSKRLQADPYRFYLSGRETIYNVHQLMDDIRKDKHPYLGSDCHIDLFAYSIGAMLSQVLLTSDTAGDFSDSKLFMFCGGALFNEMNGSSRMIMSAETFRTLKIYFTTKFIFPQKEYRIIGDNLENAFIAHVGKELFKTKRESFYELNSNRVKVISLKKDTVIPTTGIRSALGDKAQHCIEEVDFPFKYSHENPFPVGDKNMEERDYYFNMIFGKAVDFFSTTHQAKSS